MEDEIVDERMVEAKRLLYEAERNIKLLKEYGMTFDEYMYRYEAQEGKCYICGGGKKPKGNDALIVDKDREGRVRQLVCHKCKMLLSRFENDLDLYRRYGIYLAMYGYEV